MADTKGNKTDVTLMRHIDDVFVQRFKHSCLCNFYQEHKDELIIGIRNGYINIYHNCDRIAKVEFLKKTGEVRCTVNGYYLNGERNQGEKTLKSKEEIETQIVNKYEEIVKRSNKKGTAEKKAQQELCLKNNQNPDSKWVCIDVEWTKQFESKEVKQQEQFNGRFDIVAVSKSVPHKIAIIELKYGRKSLGDSSGILKHIEDFSKFVDKGYSTDFECEVKEIIKGLKALEVPLPINEGDDFCKTPCFYFIVLDNNAASSRSTTPQQTMGAYLFEEGSANYKDWNVKRPTENNVQKQLGIDVLSKDSKLQVTCLFSTKRYDKHKINDDNLEINDIIEDKSYNRYNPQ